MSAIREVKSNLKVKVSRFMSYLLRHNPRNLQMDERGFVKLNTLLRRVRERYDVDETFIRDIAYTSERPGFRS